MEKRAAKWLVELQNKAVRLDREVFGVQQPALGPFQRRLQEIGGIEPLVFGQYGELSESFEGLIDTLAVKGCDQAADHYLLDVGPGAASVQKRLLRQRVNCCVARAQAGVLLRRLKFALPGWAQAETRRKAWRQKKICFLAQCTAVYLAVISCCLLWLWALSSQRTAFEQRLWALSCSHAHENAGVQRGAPDITRASKGA